MMTASRAPGISARPLLNEPDGPSLKEPLRRPLRAARLGATHNRANVVTISTHRLWINLWNVYGRAGENLWLRGPGYPVVHSPRARPTCPRTPLVDVGNGSGQRKQPSSPVSTGPMTMTTLISIQQSQINPRSAWPSGEPVSRASTRASAGPTQECLMTHTRSGGGPN
jgi:hypothetical protein